SAEQASNEDQKSPDNDHLLSIHAATLSPSRVTLRFTHYTRPALHASPLRCLAAHCSTGFPHHVDIPELNGDFYHPEPVRKDRQPQPLLAAQME
ncbi:hypothetical protein, partial [Hoeflea sp.]|uniref:hypothetical protein n=1 Tax=Hoeflea sp. TaxID=1940281 RepID=UPI002AFE7629